MTANDGKVTVFYDGACPLCSWEIGHYRAQDRRGFLSFVDVSAADAPVPAEIGRDRALRRLHVVTESGVKSGAAAFAAVWSALPGWRWAARLARLPLVLPLLEGGYRLFLPLRPHIARLLFGQCGERAA